MTATREGKMRKDHFKSTYSSSFNENFEDLRRELSPQPGRQSVNLSYTQTPSNMMRQHSRHKRAASTLPGLT